MQPVYDSARLNCGKMDVLEPGTIVMRIRDMAALFVDYRFNNPDYSIVGAFLPLIARNGTERGTIGPRRDLPVHVPTHAEELKMAAAEPLRLTAYQYCAESPGCDVAEVRSERKDIAAVLENTVPFAAAMTPPPASQ